MGFTNTPMIARVKLDDPVQLAAGSQVGLAAGSQVGITGTPPVSVANTPGVNVQNTPGVNVQNTPNVVALTPDDLLLNSALTPLIGSGALGGGGIGTPTVPAGYQTVRLVITPTTNSVTRDGSFQALVLWYDSDGNYLVSDQYNCLCTTFVNPQITAAAITVPVRAKKFGLRVINNLGAATTFQVSAYATPYVTAAPSIDFLSGAGGIPFHNTFVWTGAAAVENSQGGYLTGWNQNGVYFQPCGSRMRVSITVVGLTTWSAPASYFLGVGQFVSQSWIGQIIIKTGDNETASLELQVPTTDFIYIGTMTTFLVGGSPGNVNLAWSFAN